MHFYKPYKTFLTMSVLCAVLQAQAVGPLLEKLDASNRTFTSFMSVRHAVLQAQERRMREEHLDAPSSGLSSPQPFVVVERREEGEGSASQGGSSGPPEEAAQEFLQQNQEDFPAIVLQRIQETCDFVQETYTLRQFFITHYFDQISVEDLPQEFLLAAQTLSVGTDGLDKRLIIQSLLERPRHYLTQEFVSAAQILTEGLDGSGKACVIQALSTVSPDQLTKDFIRTAAQTLTKDMSWFSRVGILEPLEKIPGHGAEQFDKIISPGFLEIIKPLTAWICMDMECFGSIIYRDFPEEAIKLLTARTWDESKIIEALRTVPIKDLEAFVSAVYALTNGWMVPEACSLYVEEDKVKIIEALRTVPKKDLKSFVSVARTLTAGMGGMDKTAIIQILSMVPADLFEKVAAATKPMEGHASVIEYLKTVLTVDRCEKVVSAAETLTADMDGAQRSLTIQILKTLPAESLDPFVSAAQTLTAGMDGAQKSQSIQALGEIPADRFQDALAIAQDFMSAGMGGWGIAKIIGILRTTSVEQFHNILTIAQDFMSEGRSVDAFAYMIEALGKVPEDRLTPEFISSAKNLTADMAGEDKVKSIKALGIIPMGNLKKFVSAAETLTADMDGAQRASIIQDLGMVYNLDLFVSAAQTLIAGMDGTKKAQSIQTLLSSPWDRVISYSKEAEAILRGKLNMYNILDFPRVTPYKPKEGTFSSRTSWSLVEVANLLSEDMSKEDKTSLIDVLNEVQRDLLTPRFLRAAQDLTTGRDGAQKAQSIRPLQELAAERLNKILKIAEHFMSKDMDGVQKARIIRALGEVPEDFLKPGGFIMSAKNLIKTAGTRGPSMIKALGEAALNWSMLVRWAEHD